MAKKDKKPKVTHDVLNKVAKITAGVETTPISVISNGEEVSIDLEESDLLAAYKYGAASAIAAIDVFIESGIVISRRVVETDVLQTLCSLELKSRGFDIKEINNSTMEHVINKIKEELGVDDDADDK